MLEPGGAAFRTRADREIASFEGLWPGGYFEGDPLDPMAPSTYGRLAYLSVLHATYLVCIRPYVDETTIALELGPGRGAWTRTMLHAKEVWAVDVLPSAETGFHEYVGRHPHVHYVQARDFSLSELPDDYFSYVFSFGCLCHVSFDGITEYVTRLWGKLKPGAHGFILVSDYDQYNRWLDEAPRLTVARAFAHGRRALPARFAIRMTGAWRPRHPRKDPHESNEPSPGRWYHAGRARTCQLLSDAGFVVLDPDVGTVRRDPIIHFEKPA